jgi:hypothetical protein
MDLPEYYWLIALVLIGCGGVFGFGFGWICCWTYLRGGNLPEQ